MASENELKWLDLYLETGDDKGSVRQIFECSEKNVAAKASTLKAKLSEEIDQRFAKVIKKDSIKAFRIISGLMTTATNDMTKLRAAQDVLSRAGYDSITRYENVSKEQSYDELLVNLQASFGSLDSDLLGEILGNTEDIKNINLLALGQVGTEQ